MILILLNAMRIALFLILFCAMCIALFFILFCAMRIALLRDYNDEVSPQGLPHGPQRLILHIIYNIFYLIYYHI